MTYTSLEQRMAGAYPAMFPEFVPKDSADVSTAEQKEFYDLMKRLYQLLFDDPSLIVPTLHEDDAFPSRYKKGYGKPELEVQVQKIRKAIEDLLQNMYFIGQGNAVKLNRRQLKILSLLGIADTARLPAAWTWMASREDANHVSFAYCLFDENHVYTADIYACLLGEKSFRRLEAWMLSRGYRAYDAYNTVWPNYQLTLTYANPAWSGERPNLGNEYKIKHTGISAQYDAYVIHPTALGLCIPHGLKSFLERFDSMNQRLRDFVMAHTKRCDRCGYCIQTDKTGARPLAFVPITHGQTEHELCPYFPGYTYSWTSLDDALADDIIAMLDFMDGFAPKKG